GVEQGQAAEQILPESLAALLSRRLGGDRHVAQRERTVDELEVRLLGVAPRELRAGEGVADQADDDPLWVVALEHLLGAKHGLVEAVAEDAAVLDRLPELALEEGRPGLVVVDLVAESEGITGGDDAGSGRWRRAAVRAVAVAVDRDARAPEVVGARQVRPWR